MTLAVLFHLFYVFVQCYSVTLVNTCIPDYKICQELIYMARVIDNTAEYRLGDLSSNLSQGKFLFNDFQRLLCNGT